MAAAPPRRSRRKIGLLVVLAVFLALCGRRLVHDVFSGSWHGSVAMNYLDCSVPEICRYRPDRTFGFDATGHRFDVHTNRLGFRGPDVDEPHPPDVLRVAVLGDSMVYGIGVADDETFPAQLQKRLQEAFPGRRVEVLNFGMPMTFLISNLRTYRLFARNFTPDAVVFTETRLSPKDVTYRVRELHESGVLSFLAKSGVGQRIVDAWQSSTMASYPHEDAEADVRRELELLAKDQAARPMVVRIFQFFHEPQANNGFDDVDRLLELMPPDLRYTRVWSGLTTDDYRASPWPIPGDGHPTAAGHAHFAEMLAKDLVPALQADVTPR